jgi:isocitrate dehydrogenase (NAD+)
MMLSAAMMLTHLKETEAAKRLHGAVQKVYASKTNTTGDVGGKATTEQFTDAVIKAML